MSQAPYDHLQHHSKNASYTDSAAQCYKAADWILQALLSVDINSFFGIPGGTIQPLLDAISLSEAEGINLLTCKHEGAAGFMAEGFFKESGKVAACFATSGPGATNLVTGVSSAYVEAIPMLIITAQSSSKNYGKGAMQDSSCSGVDMVSIFKNCTRYSSLISHCDQIPQKISKALNIFYSDNPGPVHLSIPVDILNTEQSFNIHPTSMVNNIMIRSDQISESIPHTIHQEIEMAQNQVTLLIGERAQDIADKLLQVAAIQDWKVVTTPRGKGLVASDFPNHCGVVGIAGHPSAIAALSPEESELILIVGATLDECSTANWDDNGVYSERVIHIDSNPSCLDYFSNAKYKFQYDLSHFADYLLLQLPQFNLKAGKLKSMRSYLRLHSNKDSHVNPTHTNNSSQHASTDTNEQFEESINDYKHAMSSNPVDLTKAIAPNFLVQHISKEIPYGTRAYMDCGSAYLWSIHYWHCQQPEPGGNLFYVNVGFTSMGWAMGAAIGAATASNSDNKDNGFICITGDGSTLMHGGELATAMENDLNIVFVILNDRSYGMVKHGQRLSGSEEIGIQLPDVDFSIFAKSMGITNHRITSYAELLSLDFKALLNNKGPVVLDVVIDAEATPPLMDRIKTLEL